MLQPINSGSPSAVAGSSARPVDPTSKPAPATERALALDQAAKPTSEELGNAVADLNKMAQAASQGVRFSVDEETGRTVVKVVDTQTDKVLRQIPTMEALKLWRSIEQMQGVMLRDKA